MCYNFGSGFWVTRTHSAGLLGVNQGTHTHVAGLFSMGKLVFCVQYTETCALYTDFCVHYADNFCQFFEKC